MNYSSDNVYYCNNNRDLELSNRIYQRNIPSHNLRPYIDTKPVMTKYSTLPVVDLKNKNHQVSLKEYGMYNVQNSFNPGQSAPGSGFFNNVNTESLLRNQFFALQKSDQSVYVPSSTSDLYNVNVVSRPVNQPHPDLFQEQEFKPFNPNIINGGTKIFNNSTRLQMLDSCKN